MSEGGSSGGGNKLTNIRTTVRSILREKNCFTYVFELAEKYTKVDREYLFWGIVGILIVYLVVGYGAGLIVNLLGFLYPAYKSCKAIDSVDKNDDTQWLTYWVVYAAFGIVEYFADLVLFWIPFYFLLKCAFLVWCMVPMDNNGAQLIYKRIIKPFIKKHEGEFDQVAEALTEQAKEITGKVISASKDAIGNVDPSTVYRAGAMLNSLSENSPKDNSGAAEGSKKED